MNFCVNNSLMHEVVGFITRARQIVNVLTLMSNVCNDEAVIVVYLVSLCDVSASAKYDFSNCGTRLTICEWS